MSVSRSRFRSSNRRPKTSAVDAGRKYFTTGRQVSAEGFRALETIAATAYRLPKHLNTLNDAKAYWREEKRRLRERDGSCVSGGHTYRSRLNLSWKMERLHVSVDTDLPGKSITEDLDPDFFNIVTGRPIKEKKRLREYLKDVRECFLTRLQTGFHEDQILLIDEQHANERKLLDGVKRNFLSCLKGFETFLMDDHRRSTGLTERAREEMRKSQEKLDLVKNLRRDVKDMETKILGVEEEWRKCRMFQEFLYLTAPADWRKTHDPNYGKGDAVGTVFDPCLFDRFRDLPAETTDAYVDGDVEEKISKFVRDVRSCRSPRLHFTDPQQILDILADLERNNLRALNHARELDFPASNAMVEVKRAKARYDADEAEVEAEIRFVTRLVEEEERKAADTERELRRIAFGLFQNLTTDEEYLTVATFVEDAYEDVVGSTDHDPDLTTMMREIELSYESVLLDLDGQPNDVMVRATKRFYRDQKREFAEAREAEKKVHQMNTLLKRLSNSLRRPAKGTRERKMVRRSQPPEERLNEMKLPRILSRTERDRMFFFGKPTEASRLHRPLLP